MGEGVAAAHADPLSGRIAHKGITSIAAISVGQGASSTSRRRPAGRRRLSHRLIGKATGANLSLDDWQAVKWRHFRRRADAVTLRSEVSQLARDLASEGVRMAVVSNSTADEGALCLSAAGLASLFPVTVSRADVAHGKPAPDGYLLAAARRGVAPNDSVVVEDSPVGVRAGLAAGAKALFHP